MTSAGSIRTTIEVYMRHECETCGEPATKRHAFLLRNARRNRASAAYGKDDIRWCADDEAFTCDECPEPKRDDMEWAGCFTGNRFQHMLHFWWTKSQSVEEAAQ